MLNTIRGRRIEVFRRQRARRIKIIFDAAIRSDTQVGPFQTVLLFLLKFTTKVGSDATNDACNMAC
jgi:hypothetical protein